MFHHLAVNYIRFAQESLKAVLQAPENDGRPLLFQNANLHYFYYMQMTLNSCSGLWNIFFTDKNFHDGTGRNKQSFSARRKAGPNDPLPAETPRARANRLRKRYCITKEEFPILSNKTFRNTNEHFDERIDSVNGELGDWNIITENTEPWIQKELLTETHLRTIDLARWKYYTCDRQMKSVSFSLKDLKCELEELEEKVKAYRPNSNGVVLKNR